ncbi:MAG: hypothetical protein V4509_05350 [Patescibacteria group bacterium]
MNYKWFKVVRGDLYPGGIKCRVLTELLATEIDADFITYAGCYYGHSAFALALAGNLTKKFVWIYFTHPWKETYIWKQLLTLNNVCPIADQDQDQNIVKAIKLAGRPGNNDEKGHYLPVGFDCEPFRRIYVKQMRELEVDPEEIWTTGGSGVTARCLAEAWPKARINVVNLGVRLNADMGNPYKVWNIPEKLCEEALDPPPWPSARYYDAKMWQIVKEHATRKSTTLIWNIA